MLGIRPNSVIYEISQEYSQERVLYQWWITPCSVDGWIYGDDLSNVQQTIAECPIQLSNAFSGNTRRARKFQIRIRNADVVFYKTI